MFSALQKQKTKNKKQIAVKREAESKGEKKRYKHLNEEF